MSRAALLAGAGMLVADCGSQATFYGACPPDSVTVSAPCGFQSITTTCAGASATCTDKPCSVVPISGNCNVVVVLGNGTSHTIAVTVSTCPFGNNTLVPSPESTDLSSTTCSASDAGLLFGDGSAADATSTDAAQDVTNEQ